MYHFPNYQAGICLLKVNNKNTRASCEICSKLTIKASERVFIANFEHISRLCSSVLIVNIEHVMISLKDHF